MEDAWDADNVSLAEMKHWEMAPLNAGRVANADILFALTTADLKNKADFWPNLRKAIENGLPEQKALEALTTVPAKLIKADDLLGTLQKGRLANFIITSGNLFSPDNVIYENWMQGKQYIVANKNAADLRGTWNLTVADRSNLKLTITGKTPAKPEFQLMVDTVKTTPKVTVSDDFISMQVQLDRRTRHLAADGLPHRQYDKRRGRNARWQSRNLVHDPHGRCTSFYVGRVHGGRQPAHTGAVAGTASTTAVGTLLYPFVGMGNAQKPKPETTLIRNATVWTNEKEGVLTNTDVLISGGKITKVGKSLAAPADGKVVDGTGKFLTSGIIDEHSHIALLSINEGRAVEFGGGTDGGRDQPRRYQHLPPAGRGRYGFATPARLGQRHWRSVGAGETQVGRIAGGDAHQRRRRLH